MIPFETEWVMSAVPSPFNSNCPNCEFLGNDPALPISCGDGILMCQVCDTKWREVDTRPKQKAPPQHMPPSIAEKTKSQAISSFVIAVVFACLAGLLLLNEWTTQFPDEITVSSNSQEYLSLSHISIESFDNSNGDILVVSGEVRNNSPFNQSVPSVVMHSGHKGSSGYFNWIYHPALQNLAPGASFRFRTSISKPGGSAGSIRLKFGGA